MVIIFCFICIVVIVVVGVVLVFGFVVCLFGDFGGGFVDGEFVMIEYLYCFFDGEGMMFIFEIVVCWNVDYFDIQVKVMKFDGKLSDMILKFEIDVKVGNGLCFVQMGYFEVLQLFVKGLLQDVVDEVMKYEDDFLVGVFSVMKVGDVIVGFFQDICFLVYFYNEVEFMVFGFDVLKMFDDLMVDLVMVIVVGKYVIVFMFDEVQNWFVGQLVVVGDIWFSIVGDEWKVDVQGMGFECVVVFWQGLFDSKQILVIECWGEGFIVVLNDGSFIGYIGVVWEVGFFFDLFDGIFVEGQWCVVQFFDFGVGVMSGFDGGFGVLVMKGCEYLVEVMEFNDWFNMQVDDFVLQGFVVVVKGSVEILEKMLCQFGGQDVFVEFVIVIENLNLDFLYVFGFLIFLKMNEIVVVVVVGMVKVVDIFIIVQDMVVVLLKDFGFLVVE